MGEGKGTLAGARTRILELKVAPKLFGSAACFFFRKISIAVRHKAHARVTHGTRHAARPNMDDNAPQTCP